MKTPALIIILLATVARAQSIAPAAVPATQPAPDRAALGKAFEAQMSGVVLVGFSTDTRRPNATPVQERYTILRVSKLPGNDDRWQFTARIPFKGGDLAVPLALPIKWAADTPVISLTDLTIP